MRPARRGTLERLPDEAFAPAIVDADRAAEELGLRNRPEESAIQAVAAMIADREHHAGRDRGVQVRAAAVVEIQERLARAEVLEMLVAERLAVDADVSVDDR